VFTFCVVHGISGKVVGLKVFYMKLPKGVTMFRIKHLYKNIVDVDGELKDIG